MSYCPETEASEIDKVSRISTAKAGVEGETDGRWEEKEGC